MNKENILRIIVLAVLVAGLFFPFISQAEDAVQGSQYLIQSVLCKDIEENEPLSETDSFLVTDEKAVCWIRFSYQSWEPFLLTWEWVNPEGNIYHMGELEMEAGDYASYRSWYWIGILDHYAANLSGDWKVRIYIDDILVAVKDFSIKS